MSGSFITFLIFASIFIQVGFINQFEFWKPDIFFLALTIIILRPKVKNPELLVLVGVILLDIFSSLPFGIVTVSVLLSFFFLRWFVEKFFGERNFLTVGIVGFSLVFSAFVLFLLLSSLYNYLGFSSFAVGGFWERFLRSVLPTALINSTILLVAGFFWPDFFIAGKPLIKKNKSHGW
ncbi:hypothetical protein C4553_01875 [Candidatus Parcubacteria bacterium]|nr:MAG: hypothetical protein C4553_01875 [Candidatus Parcubacteria bacterium]